MAEVSSPVELLSKLTSSLQSATHALPNASTASPSTDGNSLLDVKNDLLASYLQNLVFLVLLRLRNGSDEVSQGPDADEVVKKLVELRLYLDKGVRPLEGRIKYQIDKAIKAAEASARVVQKSALTHKDTRGTRDDGNEDDDDDESEKDVTDELAFRPNLEAFTRQPEAQTSTGVGSRSDGAYRPPRITPTALPQSLDDKKKATRKPMRSHIVDEYIDAELSNAPVAQPSIGTTIREGGRRTTSDKERRQEAERTAYEEANFTRLPPISKKEKARQTARRPVGFGGEELRGLNDGLGRIDRLTSKKRSGGSTRVEEPRSNGTKRRKVGRR